MADQIYVVVMRLPAPSDPTAALKKILPKATLVEVRLDKDVTIEEEHDV